MHFCFNNNICFENHGENTEDSSKFSQWEFWEYVKNEIFNTYDQVDKSTGNQELKYKDLVIYKDKPRSNGKDYISEESVIDFCENCGKDVWGDKMFNAILSNMNNARNKGDLEF